MKCPECGSENIDGSDECWSCSESLRPARASRGGKQDWVVWTIAGIASLVVIVMLLTSSSNPAGAGSKSGGGATNTVAATGSVPTTRAAPAIPPTGTKTP